MFIKLSTLARMMKKADKAGTLRIGCDTDDKGYGGYYIEGTYWCVHILWDECPKEIKAEIVKYLGDMPKGGEEWQLQKGYAQGCTYGAVNCYLPEIQAKCKGMVMRTRYLIEDSDIYVRVYQGSRSGEIFGVNEKFLEILDKDADSDFDFYAPEKSQRGSLIWSDDDTIVEIRPFELKNTMFADFTAGIDLTLPDNPPQEITDKKEKGEESNAMYGKLPPEMLQDPEDEEPGENSRLNILPPAPDPE